MLKIAFNPGHSRNMKLKFIGNVDEYFDKHYTTDWLSNRFAKKVIKMIDKVEYSGGNLIKPLTYGGVEPTELSKKVKAILIMYNTDEIVWASHCGNDINCINKIIEISKKKDLTICLSHIMLFDYYRRRFLSKVLNTNKQYYNSRDLVLSLIELQGKNYTTYTC